MPTTFQPVLPELWHDVEGEFCPNPLFVHNNGQRPIPLFSAFVKIQYWYGPQSPQIKIFFKNQTQYPPFFP
ncbi:hypothetical protein L248_1034 [Schleiferilactobacillus shenzhenensis LY-73]|uniref:Uncharacterized protein n=1 Tax=Schleiferilactobacillus shenzhenensis LY-73 TaxID=1231336 RepID=U4TSB5_9LACO|nr:hypothetical protein L248_1034 [Schleiferilactobacillus shenzhenensis LY-73]